MSLASLLPLRTPSPVNFTSPTFLYSIHFSFCLCYYLIMSASIRALPTQPQLLLGFSCTNNSQPQLASSVAVAGMSSWHDISESHPPSSGPYPWTPLRMTFEPFSVYPLNSPHTPEPLTQYSPVCPFAVPTTLFHSSCLGNGGLFL